MSLRRKPEAALGKDLRRLREAAGLSREQLAEQVDFSARQIARWENGEGRPRGVVRQHLLGLKPPAPQLGDFRFIDLFAGIGGFRMGLQSVGGQCVFTSEWNAYSRKTYHTNFGDHEVQGDITGIGADQIPDHEVLAAGFPCQPFSIAGVSKKNSLGRKHGFEDETQGTLFFDIVRILKKKQPKAFILENVKNLASHDKGNTLKVILRSLRQKLRYRVEMKIVDARCLVPQHRERVFLVGLHPDLQASFDWNDVVWPARDRWPVLRSILHGGDWPEQLGFDDGRYVDAKGRVLDKYVLSDHLWAYLQNYAKKHQAAGNGFGFGLVGPDDVARTLSARYYKDGSEILIKRRGNPRRLTPRECARLMGFDKPGEAPFKIPVSDTQAYKQFGNAVAVPVVERIAQALLPYVKGERKGAAIQQSLDLDAA